MTAAMHQDYEPCPACGGWGDKDCYLCHGDGQVESENPDTQITEPVDVTKAVRSICPKCARRCELRLEDGARWCRACDEMFRTETGWPDILEHMDE